MTDRELDGLMRRVLLDSLKLDWERKLEPGSFFAPSASHKRQIRAMLADPLAWAHKKAVPVWKRTMQRAAVVLLILSLGFGGLLAASPTVRAAFFGWVREVCETYFSYHYVGEDRSDMEEIVYRPAWVPEGYDIIWESHDKAGGDIVYQNKDEKIVSFSWSRNIESSAFQVDSETAEIKNTFIGNSPADLYLENDKELSSVLVWTDYKNGTIFVIMAPFDENEITKMAEGVFGDTDCSGNY